MTKFWSKFRFHLYICTEIFSNTFGQIELLYLPNGMCKILLWSHQSSLICWNDMFASSFQGWSIYYFWDGLLGQYWCHPAAKGFGRCFMGRPTDPRKSKLDSAYIHVISRGHKYHSQKPVGVIYCQWHQYHNKIIINIHMEHHNLSNQSMYFIYNYLSTILWTFLLSDDLFCLSASLGFLNSSHFTTEQKSVVVIRESYHCPTLTIGFYFAVIYFHIKTGTWSTATMVPNKLRRYSLVFVRTSIYGVSQCLSTTDKCKIIISSSNWGLKIFQRMLAWLVGNHICVSCYHSLI